MSSPASVIDEFVAPGFVDHHSHLLTYAAAYKWPSEDRWFPELAVRGSNPMDEPWPGRCGDDELSERIQAALLQAAAAGYVRVVEMGIPDLSTYEAALALSAAGPLPISVEIYLASGLADQLGPDRVGELLAHRDPWVRVTGVKLYLDGWLSLRTCAVSQPYADTGNTGLLFMDAETAARRMESYVSTGLQIATHAIGDRAIETALRAYELVFGDAETCRRAAPRIEHAQLLRHDLIERMAEWGVVACIQPGFHGMEQGAARSLPDSIVLHNWRLLNERGGRLIAGSDHPITEMSAPLNLRQLTQPAGADHTLDLDDALAAMTDPEAGTTTLVGTSGLRSADAQVQVASVEPRAFH